MTMIDDQPTKTLPKPPREGSRKAEVYAVFFAEGFDAAREKAAALELAPSTVKSWASTWKKLREPSPDEPDETNEAKFDELFAYERDLQNFVVKNLDRIESGLRLHGREIDAGRSAHGRSRHRRAGRLRGHRAEGRARL
jgi:hypothetical protein